MRVVAGPSGEGPLPAAPVSPDDAAAAADARPGTWGPDVLGEHYERMSLPLGEDAEGPVVASLVRYRPDPALTPARAILYVHGWSDYFFQTHLAEYWHHQGVAFYALDLRKFGRSLRPWQTPGYIDSLRTYDEDLAAACEVVCGELPAGGALMVFAHSLGGLVASLWADRHPGVVRGLILNSPWLELQGSAVMRALSAPAVRPLARLQPRQVLPNLDLGFYSRSVRATDGGEWEFDERWRPTPSFPVRPGWLNAVMAGHAAVASGLHITVPILMLASTRTLLAPRWHEEMRRADVVLETDWLARRAVGLGTQVTVTRIPGAIHDVVLSAPPVREHVLAEITRWCSAYGWV